MKPDSNKPAHLYEIVTTHKFENVEQIKVANLKFETNIDPSGKFTYKATNAI